MIWVVLTLLLVIAGFVFFYVKIRIHSVTALRKSLLSRSDIRARVLLLKEMGAVAASYPKPSGVALETIPLGGGRVELKEVEVETAVELEESSEIVKRLDSMVDSLSLEACAELSKHQKFFNDYQKSIARLRTALKEVSS